VKFSSFASVRTTWYSVRTLVSQATSVQTMRTFRPDFLLCPEASNCSKLHPLDVSATCPDAFKCSTSKKISFPNIDMGRQLQPSGRRDYFVQTLSLIRQVMHKILNQPDVSLHYPDAQSLLWKLRAAEVQQFGR